MRIHDEAAEVVRRCPPLPAAPCAVRRVVVELPEHPATIVPVPTPAPTPQGPVTTIARPARGEGGGPPDVPPDVPLDELEPPGRGEGDGGDEGGEVPTPASRDSGCLAWLAGIAAVWLVAFALVMLIVVVGDG